MTAPTLADALPPLPPLPAAEAHGHDADSLDPIPFYTAEQMHAYARAYGAALAAADAAVPQGEAVPVAWLRDQRGAYEGPAALEPLFLLGWNPPGPGRAATYSPLYAAQPAVPTPQPVQAVPLTREQIADIVREHLTSMYACTRVWEAWSVGTMTEDDFVPAEETDMADDIAAALVARITGGSNG
jgi:hypothetical protein